MTHFIFLVDASNKTIHAQKSIVLLLRDAIIRLFHCYTIEQGWPYICETTEAQQLNLYENYVTFNSRKCIFDRIIHLSSIK